MGAEVIKIEEPGCGDEARMRGPFPNDVPHTERSALFLYLNTSKLGITLNTKTPTGVNILTDLLREADIFIGDKSPQTLSAAGIDLETIRGLNSRLVVTSVTAFGQTGPHAEYRSLPLTTYQSGLIGHLTPHGSDSLERAPLKAGGNWGEYACGLSAALGALAALYARGASGVGQRVDLSKQEALLAIERVFAPRYPNSSMSDNRAIARPGGLGDLLPCKDGHFVFQINELHHWHALVQLMGNPEWAQDEAYDEPRERGNRYASVIRPHVLEWAANHTAKEIYHQGQAANCPLAAVMSAEGVMHSEHMKAREFFVDVDHPQAGKIRYPEALCKFSETPFRIENPAPLLGQHNEYIYCGRLGYAKQEMVKLREAGII